MQRDTALFADDNERSEAADAADAGDDRAGNTACNGSYAGVIFLCEAHAIRRALMWYIRFEIAGFLLLTAVLSGCMTAGPNDDPRALRENSDRVTEAMMRMEEAQMKRDVEHVESVPVRLLQLSPEFKARLHLHLLDFRQPPPHHAELMARADIDSGDLNILTGGMNIYNKSLRAFLLSEYQIEVMNIADCDDGEAIFRLIDCYNAIVETEITKKTGKHYEEILREYTARKNKASSDQSGEKP